MLDMHSVVILQNELAIGIKLRFVLDIDSFNPGFIHISC